MRNNDYTATSIEYKVYQLLEIISVYSAVIMYIIICNNVLFSQPSEFWNAGIVQVFPTTLESRQSNSTYFASIVYA